MTPTCHPITCADLRGSPTSVVCLTYIVGGLWQGKWRWLWNEWLVGWFVVGRLQCDEPRTCSELGLGRIVSWN